MARLLSGLLLAAGFGLAASAQAADAELVKRGEYLARAADCMACHTAEGGAPYAGGLPIASPFGTIYGSNITPDKDHGIGAYSAKERDVLYIVCLHGEVHRLKECLQAADPKAFITVFDVHEVLGGGFAHRGT